MIKLWLNLKYRSERVSTKVRFTFAGFSGFNYVPNPATTPSTPSAADHPRPATTCFYPDYQRPDITPSSPLPSHGRKGPAPAIYSLEDRVKTYVTGRKFNTRLLSSFYDITAFIWYQPPKPLTLYPLKFCLFLFLSFSLALPLDFLFSYYLFSSYMMYSLTRMWNNVLPFQIRCDLHSVT